MPLRLREVRETLLARLDPQLTVPAAVLSRLTLPPDWEPDDPIATIMAAPSFDTPMYEPLRDLCGERCSRASRRRGRHRHAARDEPALHRGLHGRPEPRAVARAPLARVPDRPARRPISASSGIRAASPSAADGGRARGPRDIAPTHTWPGRNHLGDNASHGNTAPLVLLICSDLLNRNPDAVIYATKVDRRPNEAGRYRLTRRSSATRCSAARFRRTSRSSASTSRPRRSRAGPPRAGTLPIPAPAGSSCCKSIRRSRASASTRPAPHSRRRLARPELGGRRSARRGHISLADTHAALATAGSPLAAAWASDAGALAVQTLQTPFRVAISGDDMLA